MMWSKFMLKKGDIILVIILLLAALSAVAGIKIFRDRDSGGEKIAIIKQGDKIIKQIKLNEMDGSEILTVIGDYENVILIEKGRIRFEKSTCPDHICVNTGWLEGKGDIAVCLPNHVIVKIEGVKKDIDGAVY